jgi:hypothetical protein
MGQCKAREAMLMWKEVVVNVMSVSGMVRDPESRAENLLIGVYQGKGDILDGMVRARLSNFVVRFPNLGMVGSGIKNNIVGDNLKKTASCQLEFSGGKRKRDKLSKFSFISSYRAEIGKLYSKHYYILL